MSRLDELADLFGGAKLPMKSNRRRGGNGVSYTDRELRCARFAARLVFTVANIEISEPISDKEIEDNEDFQILYDIFVAMSDSGFSDAASAIRRTYKAFEEMMLDDDTTMNDFPLMDGYGSRKGRSQSSLTVMFRTALSNLVSREVLDQLFKLYQPSKNKASQ